MKAKNMSVAVVGAGDYIGAAIESVLRQQHGVMAAVLIVHLGELIRRRPQMLLGVLAQQLVHFIAPQRAPPHKRLVGQPSTTVPLALAAVCEFRRQHRDRQMLKQVGQAYLIACDPVHRIAPEVDRAFQGVGARPDPSALRQRRP